MKKLSFLKTFLVLFVLIFSASAFASEEAKTCSIVDASTSQTFVITSYATDTTVDSEKEEAKEETRQEEDTPRRNGFRGVWDG